MKNKIKSSSIIGALGAIAVAIMGLLGYLPGMRLLGSIRETYIPMAPITAISFIVLGFILLILNVKQLSGAKAIIPLIVTLLVSLFGILEVAGYFSGIDLNFENTLVPIAGNLNGIPIARMSPATGAAFFLSGVVVFFLILQQKLPERNTLIEYFGSGLGILVLLISFVFCLAYFYGTPLLYGHGTTIPMALTTALGFMFLSISILTSEKNAFPLRLLTGNSTRSYLLRFIFPLSTLSVILGGLTVLYSGQTSKMNPAFISAALTVLIAMITGFVATLISRHMGSKIDRSEAAVKRANEELQASEENLRTILHSIGDAVIAADINGKIIQINPIAEKLTGWKFEESEGRQLTEIFKIFNGQTRKVVENPVNKVLATAEIIGLANYSVLISKDGTECQIADSAAPIKGPDGKITGVVLVFRDVTEEFRMQEELQKMQKLKSVGILAGGIAHDFNNILMGLYGNISLTKEELSKDHPAFKSLEGAENSMNRAIRLTKQLLTFARGGEPVRANVRIDELVKEITRFDLSGSNIKPVLEQVDDLWMADVDKGQIQQVFSNLTINAKQAMPDGGHLYITLENADFSEDMVLNPNQGKYIKVTVRDEGTGIDQKFLDRIFDPYFSTKQTGSGLGLATVYSIINKHGGCIRVDSQLEKGTTFTLYLPASESQRGTETRQSASEHSTREQAARILVMDDEEMICRMVEQMLGRSGFSVETASGGRQAIEMYKQALDTGEPFDAVIMDLTIPGGIGGKEAVKDILKINPEARVIVSSGYANDPVMANFAEYGFHGIIAKPYTKSKLLEVLSQVLEK